MKGTVIALPGFLGIAKDWQTIVPDAQVPVFPVAPYGEWVSQFNAWASTLPAPRLLAGYSLGGRLALHALIEAPKLWDQAVIVSAHTGLRNAVLRKKRCEEDAKWAIRFENDPWHELMKGWNQRGALKSSLVLQRQESDYQRQQLSKALTVWSLGLQENLKSAIEALPMPLLWLAGEKDFSFSQIAQSINFSHLKSRAVIVPHTGHRLLHDQPSVITKEWPWKL